MNKTKTTTPAKKAKQDKWAAAAARRNKRKGFSENKLRQKMWAPERSGMYQYWANDEGGRIEELLDKGFTFVEDGDERIYSEEKAGRKQMRVGADERGAPIRAYLMEQPEEWRAQDIREEMQEISDVENQMLKGKVSGGLTDKDSPQIDIRIDGVKYEG